MSAAMWFFGVCLGWIAAGVVVFVDHAVKDLRHRGEVAEAPDA